MKFTSRFVTPLSLAALAACALGSSAYRAFFSSTSDHSPGTASQASWTGAVNAYSDEQEVKTDDDVRASVNAASRTYKLKVSNFGFSPDIDATDQIDGIRVTVNGYEPLYALNGSEVYGGHAILLDDSGAEVAEKAIYSNPFLPVSGTPTPVDGERRLGTYNDLWGQSAGYWDGKVIDSDFGVVLWFSYTNVGTTHMEYIDSITMKIWYTNALTGEHRVATRTGKVEVVPAR